MKILLTGSSKGIGFNIASILINEGHDIALHYNKNKSALDALIKDLKTNSFTIQSDLSDSSQVKDLVNNTIDKLSFPDCIINNAGIAGPSFKTWEYPIDQWQNVIDIDLTGLFYCCKSVVPHMIKANYGRIVNIASIAGKEGNPNAMPYSAAKAGVIALTKSLGKELADKNIAVNCVTPAAAKTRIFDQISQEHIDYMLSKIPRGRFIKVDELASMVSWLVSEENSYTTGAVFDLSGGRATY